MTPRAVLRIARWEIARGVGELDRRALVVAAVAVLALGGAAPLFAQGAGAPNTGVYRVGVDRGSPYYEAVRFSDRLRVVPPRSEFGAGGPEILVSGTEVRVQDSPKGRAAAAALRRAVEAYNDHLMEREPDRAAAFPVDVSLRYVEQGRAVTATGAGGTEDATGGDGTGGGNDGGDEGDQTADSANGDGADGDSGDLGGAIRSVGRSVLGGSQAGSPSDIQPPFPLQSLILAFVFVLPLNVAIQAYGSSVIDERIDRRGEAMLVAPVSRGDIIAGKTLPYLGGTLAVTAGIAAVIGGGPLSVAAVAPLALLFLATTFVAALFARSFKELTFLTVTISVFLTTYAFVPAVFTDVHPIASISPLSIVVHDLTGAPVDAGMFLVATGPMALAALALFGLGAGIYREEDLFTQRPPPAKALDALAAHLTARRTALWSALSVPFVLVAELFAVATLFLLPLGVSLPLLLGVLAGIEELAKSLHLYAGFRRARFGTDARTALRVGALSGVGFAVGEKAFLLTQLVGLPDLELGRAAFAPAAANDPLLLIALLIAPFALHAVTAMVSARGARRSARAYGVALVAAVLLHIGYNAAVVTALA